MGRSSESDDMSGLKQGPWTPEEDQNLVDYIYKNGHGNWRALPKLAGLNRYGKSCRLRWTNYLRPVIKRGKFSDDEEKLIQFLSNNSRDDSSIDHFGLKSSYNVDAEFTDANIFLHRPPLKHGPNYG
ncbi:hypothetical protein RND71_030409 [Anisodus tanguticus]|uniref:Uncharacterized protein n=1 Tax=Anisodus tanguticus TaxID=243964 RepID=A0AAE1RHF3_9SOLA|nr:hypothetical protein RND71_030409 [Anisodus tanguticus]